MTRITLFVAAAGAALMAGCSGGATDADGDGEITAKEVAAKADAEMVRPQPGLYKATITMTGVDIPGMPPEMKNHGAGMTTTVEECLTEKDVEKGFEEMVKQGQQGECSFEEFDLNGGKMDGVLVCKTPQGESRMTMSGTTTPTSSEFTASTKIKFEGMGEGTMNFTAKNERIGDCPAK
ncbi:DUF3617 domain-containing protein [Erythrobacter donghaensis]|uniref:DUF3617 domain-containing protein n=1 Tax=Erythrobacter donghaensis TaxID=267135 RepID=UPI0013028ED2|nr:DUF3617 domain-containing protein [Erythrobacter donghaensis]